jgi:zinc transporter 2
MLRKKQAEESNRKACNKLLLVATVSIFFLVVQLAGAFLSGSIALLSDSAHLFSDLVGFAISMISLTIA